MKVLNNCGFVSAPVVTAIMRGNYCPSIQVWAVSDTRLYFMGFVTVEDGTASKMVCNECDVFWSATGYICR